MRTAYHFVRTQFKLKFMKGGSEGGSWVSKKPHGFKGVDQKSTLVHKGDIVGHKCRKIGPRGLWMTPKMDGPTHWLSESLHWLFYCKVTLTTTCFKAWKQSFKVSPYDVTVVIDRPVYLGWFVKRPKARSHVPNISNLLTQSQFKSG